MKILEHLEKINALLSEAGLCKKFYTKAREHINAASAFLNISQIQTVLFALLLEHFGEGSMPIIKLSDELKCRKLEILKYLDDFEDLEKKGLIKTDKKPKTFSNFLRNKEEKFPNYSVPFDVINAVRKGIEYKAKTYSNLSPIEFFDCVAEMLDAVREEDMDLDSFIAESRNIFEQNKHICFVKCLATYELGENSFVLMLIFCDALFNDNDELIQFQNLQSIFGYTESRKIVRRFQSREHKLFVNNLIEFSCKMGMADTEYYCLSQKAKDEFLADVDLGENKKHQGKNIISTKSITEKILFYNKKIEGQIRELTELLQENNFNNIQKRLSNNGLRTGFPCIFSGPPGTGKTEAVYQIARLTGRDIVLVDIAETKSMWFGESEKRIKAVFDRYKGMVKSDKLAPILLFNEADAILSKRQELSNAQGGVGQTENAIQNIILQEMEDMKGILIATTNLTINLDKAFERRFLYKIEFEKPDTTSKALIWQNLIPVISNEDAVFLSCRFDLSGGQIENIYRKCAVDYILTETLPSLERLISFCEVEQLNKANSFKIGFGA